VEGFKPSDSFSDLMERKDSKEKREKEAERNIKGGGIF